MSQNFQSVNCNSVVPVEHSCLAGSQREKGSLSRERHKTGEYANE